MNKDRLVKILAELKSRGVDAYSTQSGHIEALGTYLVWDGSRVEHWYMLANEKQVRDFLAAT